MAKQYHWCYSSGLWWAPCKAVNPLLAYVISAWYLPHLLRANPQVQWDVDGIFSIVCADCHRCGMIQSIAKWRTAKKSLLSRRQEIWLQHCKAVHHIFKSSHCVEFKQRWKVQVSVFPLMFKVHADINRAWRWQLQVTAWPVTLYSCHLPTTAAAKASKDSASSHSSVHTKWRKFRSSSACNCQILTARDSEVSNRSHQLSSFGRVGRSRSRRNGKTCWTSRSSLCVYMFFSRICSWQVSRARCKEWY